MSDAADLERGLDAVGRHDWVRARALLAGSAATAGSVAGLAGLALSCWWLDDGPGFVKARERLFRLYQERREPLEAGRVAVRLSWDVEIVGQEAVLARAWLDRAHALIDRGGGGPSDRTLCELRDVSLQIADDPAAAVERARAARVAAIELGDPDLESLALVCEGEACFGLNDLAGGIRALEQAALIVCSGDATDPLPVTLACCRLLQACADVRDYERAAAWLPRVVERSAANERGTMAVIGRCSTLPLLLGRGLWRDADAAIADGLGHFGAGNEGWERSLNVSLAELRFRQGRLAEAQELLERAEPHRRCRLVYAAMALAAGDADRACRQVDAFQRRPGRRSVHDDVEAFEVRSRAEALRGDRVAAEAARDVLAAIAEQAGTASLAAAVRRCDGAIALADGDAPAAVRALEDAVDLYVEAGALFDGVAARNELAAALDATGRADAANEYRRAAASMLAALDPPVRDCPLTDRELDVVALIARGHSNARIARELVVSPHTVHRHVANILARLGCTTRAAAVAIVTAGGWLADRPVGDGVSGRNT